MNKVLMLSIWYPLAMSRYFEKSLQHRLDVDLRTVGPYTGASIPWMGGMTLPMKYAKSPYYPTYPVVPRQSWLQVKNMLGDWKPDLILTVDAGITFDKRPDIGCPVYHVATDPHVLNYDFARSISDKFFNMQDFYSIPGDIYLPYAFSQFDHYIEPETKDADAVLIGMPYEHRTRLVGSLRSRGVSVLFENGPVYDEYRQINNKAHIGLNWSSMKDMVARVFELMAMRLCPVINRVPDLPKFFVEGEHYLGFDSIEEAVEKVLWAKEHPTEAEQIAENAWKKVWKPDSSGYPQHSYCDRVEQILKSLEGDE